MIFRTPDFYRDFHCIADRCSDSCCIGWEIDIDPDTLARYQAVPGPFGEELKQGIVQSEDGASCFRLDASERCVFLDQRNLCRIYSQLGEDALCTICTRHPRFFNWFGPVKEGGHGLCCEEAARLWLCRDTPLTLVSEEIDEAPDGALPQWFPLLEKARGLALSRLEAPELPLWERLGFLLALGELLQPCVDEDDFPQAEALVEALGENELAELTSSKPHSDPPAALLEWHRGLSPMNPQWPRRLQEALEKLPESWETRSPWLRTHGQFLQNLAVYLCFRYFLRACLDGDVAGRCRFIVSACLTVLALALTEDGPFPLLAKDYSKEMEYSEEALDAISEAVWQEPLFSPANLLGWLRQLDSQSK